MKTKPLIFSILSILCFIEPVIKVLYFKVATHFDFMVIIANLQARNTFMEVFDFWLVFPIAGILIMKLRKWTYFAFMSVLAYIMYNISTYEKYTWPYNSETPFLYNYVVVAASAIVFVFFLFPKVREPFFDRRVRWWEPHSRYAVNITCRVHGMHLTFPSQILNISQTGAFLQESPYLKVGDKLHLEFCFFGQMIDVPVEVVHRSQIRNKSGYGVRFISKNVSSNLKIAKLINIIKRSHGIFNDAAVAQKAA